MTEGPIVVRTPIATCRTGRRIWLYRELVEGAKSAKKNIQFIRRKALQLNGGLTMVAVVYERWAEAKDIEASKRVEYAGFYESFGSWTLS